MKPFLRLKTRRPFILNASLLSLAVVLSACGGDPDPDPVPDTITPFSVTVRVPDSTVGEVAAALADHLQSVDDSLAGWPGNWVVAGASELLPDQEPIEATLKLPTGSRIVEVCNHHYAEQAMAFGGHHGVALPCEIAVNQVEQDVEVVMLNPEAIFGAFFTDVPAEYQDGMGGLAAAVRSELETLISDALQPLGGQFLGRDVGPAWGPEEMADFAQAVYSVEMDMDIPADSLAGAGPVAFRDDFVDSLLTTLTHEHMETVGSQVEGLSVQDWRAARPYALGLPGGVAVVEVCSPTYASAAMGAGSLHAPALPCQIAIWVDSDQLRVHVLDPAFIFGTFFSDAPEEMKEQMGGLADAVRDDITRMVAAAQVALLDR